MTFNRTSDLIYTKYSEEEILKYMKKKHIRSKKNNELFWNLLAIYQDLSEDFIRRFRNKWKWYYICRCQNLSESFIKEFINRVDWSYLVKYQNLSEEFLINNLEKINLKWLEKNKKIPEDVKRRIISLMKLLESD